MGGITDPTEAYFKDGAWGWDGTQWRKLALLWGFSERWVQSTLDTASGAGDAEVSTTAVAAGYVYVVQAVAVRHNAGANKELKLGIHNGGTAVWLLHELTAATDLNYMIQPELVMAEGDYLKATAVAPGDGKRVYLHAWGYKMKVAE